MARQANQDELDRITALEEKVRTLRLATFGVASGGGGGGGYSGLSNRFGLQGANAGPGNGHGLPSTNSTNRIAWDNVDFDVSGSISANAIWTPSTAGTYAVFASIWIQPKITGTFGFYIDDSTASNSGLSSTVGDQPLTGFKQYVLHWHSYEVMALGDTRAMFVYCPAGADTASVFYGHFFGWRIDG